jgi:hypothetical protein
MTLGAVRDTLVWMQSEYSRVVRDTVRELMFSLQDESFLAGRVVNLTLIREQDNISSASNKIGIPYPYLDWMTSERSEVMHLSSISKSGAHLLHSLTSVICISQPG